MKSFIFTSAFLLLTTLTSKAVAAVATDSTLYFAQGTVQATAHWALGPDSSTESILSLQFVDAGTHAAVDLSASTVKVALFMPMMGHGSSPTTVTQVVDGAGHLVPGVYQVSKIYFSMDGEWEVRVTVKNADGSSETQTFTVNL